MADQRRVLRDPLLPNELHVCVYTHSLPQTPLAPFPNDSVRKLWASGWITWITSPSLPSCLAALLPLSRAIPLSSIPTGDFARGQARSHHPRRSSPLGFEGGRAPRAASTSLLVSLSPTFLLLSFVQAEKSVTSQYDSNRRVITSRNQALITRLDSPKPDPTPTPSR